MRNTSKTLIADYGPTSMTLVKRRKLGIFGAESSLAWGKLRLMYTEAIRIAPARNANPVGAGIINCLARWPINQADAFSCSEYEFLSVLDEF